MGGGAGVRVGAEGDVKRRRELMKRPATPPRNMKSATRTNLIPLLIPPPPIYVLILRLSDVPYKTYDLGLVIFFRNAGLSSGLRASRAVFRGRSHTFGEVPACDASPPWDISLDPFHAFGGRATAATISDLRTS